MSTTQTAEKMTLHVVKERDKYRRSVTRYIAYSEGRRRILHTAAIVRLPRTTFPEPTWMVSTNLRNGVKPVHYTNRKHAVAHVESLPWVIAARAQ